MFSDSEFKHSTHLIGDFSFSFSIAKRGKNLLLWFPGYGQTEQQYQHWLKIIPNDWSLMVMDHFGWRNSYSKTGEKDPLKWSQAFKKLMLQINLKPEKIVLGGFSFGNWLASTYAKSLYESLSGVIFFSSPGWRFETLFKFGTKTFLGNQLLHLFSKHTGTLLIPLLFLTKLGLYNQNRMNMLSQQLAQTRLSSKLPQNWEYMKSWIPNWNSTLTELDKRGISVLCLAGTSDSITPPKEWEKRLPSTTKIKLFKGGHQHKNRNALFMIADFLAGIH